MSLTVLPPALRLPNMLGLAPVYTQPEATGRLLHNLAESKANVLNIRYISTELAAATSDNKARSFGAGKLNVLEVDTYFVVRHLFCADHYPE